MKLSEFVRDAIKQIAEGVQDARNNTMNTTTDVCPIAPEMLKGASITNIDFEISTIVKDVTEKSGEVKSQIWVASGSGNLRNTQENHSIATIKFSVPAAFGTLSKTSDK